MTTPVSIAPGHITLAQLLKKLDFISSGGEAKLFLSHEVVRVNGEIDQRRGRKLIAGDVVVIQGQSYELVES